MRHIIYRQIIGSILVAATLLIVSSCCTKKGCIGIGDLNEITFYNFSIDNLDTVTIKRFEKNTNFATPLDSTPLTPNYLSPTADYKTIYLSGPLLIAYDYQVVLESTGQVFALSDFSIEHARCNTGVFCNDFYDRLESYKVNGQTISYGSLLLTQ